MKTRKIILFIVEGVSDKTSLALILSKLVKNKNVQFQIVHGDITSNRYTTVTNVKTKIGEQVKKFMSSVYRKSDILKVVHLIDTDGAYVDESYIKQGEVDTFIYSPECIEARNIDKVIQRNEKKKKIVNILSTTSKVLKDIDYCMYYFSCNLEHVLHNECNMDDDKKREVAENFADSFYNREDEFVKFIKNESFAVQGDYGSTWEFIKKDNNSLNRYCNFHLFFDE